MRCTLSTSLLNGLKELRDCRFYAGKTSGWAVNVSLGDLETKRKDFLKQKKG